VPNPKENLKRIKTIKLKEVRTFEDNEFIKTIRHAKGSDNYWQKIGDKKGGEVKVYKLHG